MESSRQAAKVVRVIEHIGAKSFILAADPARGTDALAPFRAGQFISIQQRIGNAYPSRPYSIRSGPGEAEYAFTLERCPDGLFSPNALDNWQPGTEVWLSQPAGDFYWDPARDAGHIIALAGGSGVTPFFSMASAIADGIEPFEMTILYGSPTYERIILREELEAIAARSNGKVRLVHVLSKEPHEGCEFGFITADLIRKYAPKTDYTIRVCGPGPMYRFLHEELPKLGLPEERIRFEIPGEFGDPSQDPSYPNEAVGKTFRVTARVNGVDTVCECPNYTTLLRAMEYAGIAAESRCRSGRCGWCRAKLISGQVFIPTDRAEPEAVGTIRPCVTYPLSDVIITPVVSE